jgi:hypothetical protein
LLAVTLALLVLWLQVGLLLDFQCQQASVPKVSIPPASFLLASFLLALPSLVYRRNCWQEASLILVVLVSMAYLEDRIPVILEQTVHRQTLEESLEQLFDSP